MRYFNGNFRPLDKYLKQDLSREEEDVYLEISPYAVDKESGEVLNNTSKPVIKKVGTINVYNKIQSYKEDCDIYSILARVSKGEEGLLTQNVGSFGDFVDIPDNVHDLVRYIDNAKKEFQKLNPSSQKSLLSNDPDIQSIIRSEVASVLNSMKIKQADNQVKEGDVNVK